MVDRGLHVGDLRVPRRHLGHGHAVPGGRRPRPSSSSAPPASAPCDATRSGSLVAPAPRLVRRSWRLPATVPAGDVVGVRVVFTGTAGRLDRHRRKRRHRRCRRRHRPPRHRPLDRSAHRSDPDHDEHRQLRDDHRHRPGGRAAVGDQPPSVTRSTRSCPPTLSLEPTKSFFPDANGNFQTDPGEHAVIGENSGVSMNMTARNTSAFPIAEIVVTEPRPSERVRQVRRARRCDSRSRRAR